MRGAIFDVDGTLLDSMQVWWDVVVDFFKEHGVELPYEEAKEYKEMTMKESIPTIKNRLNLDLSFEELSNTFMHMGLKQYETTVPLKKGADKYLKKLHNSGIKIAIATSGYEELCKTAFTRLGVWNYIDACAFSSEVGVNKSNPDVYLLAAKRIGIPPEECTVFEDIKIPFCEGLNVLVGENGVGKTHIMKLAYAACQASKHDVSFSQKTTMLFRPDQSGIGRLVNRGKSGSNKAMVSVESDTAKIGMTFSTKTRKWDAEINSEEKWEKQMSDLTSVFIPAKEILSNAWNLDAAVKMGNVEFDDTYLDIIAAAKIDISRGVDSTVRKKYLDILQKISNGKVTLHEDRFYLKPGTQAKLEFNLVAEGLRKIALLWQLIKNGTLEKGSVLFWDEPEANINPKYIPVLAELLIMLETEGVQIFVSTHDYFLSKYIEVKRRQDSKLQYISLYKNENNKVLCEIAPEFELLEHNAIMDTFRQLYREEIGVALK